jgi:hypothetical protein
MLCKLRADFRFFHCAASIPRLPPRRNSLQSFKPSVFPLNSLCTRVAALLKPAVGSRSPDDPPAGDITGCSVQKSHGTG